MNLREIKKHLIKKVDVLLYDKLQSTNTTAKECALNGAREGTVVIAKKQENGRGRLGRSFISNSENGIYMSIILKPEISPRDSVFITAMASVATLLAVEKTSESKPRIKWVNDLYINDRKICGILTEAMYNSQSKSLDYVICGIGINVECPHGGFDSTIKDIAGAIFKKAPKHYKSILCAEIINTFFELYENYEGKDFMSIYREKSCIVGKNVDVYVGDRVVFGEAIDINENAELVIRTKNGDVYSFNSGEARVREVKGASYEI